MRDTFLQEDIFSIMGSNLGRVFGVHLLLFFYIRLTRLEWVGGVKVLYMYPFHGWSNSTGLFCLAFLC